MEYSEYTAERCLVPGVHRQIASVLNDVAGGISCGD